MKSALGQKGQALMETLLLAFVFLAATQLAFKQLHDREIFQRAFADPWVRLTNIIHFGVNTDSEKQARANHPANGDRHLTRVQR